MDGGQFETDRPGPADPEEAAYLARRSRILEAHPGRWIIVDPDWRRVYGSGSRIGEAVRQALEAGCREPVAYRVPDLPVPTLPG